MKAGQAHGKDGTSKLAGAERAGREDHGRVLVVEVVVERGAEDPDLRSIHELGIWNLRALTPADS